MPKVVDHEEARTRIRHAAKTVFAARGVDRTSLAAVAEQAGMGRATLYHYYPHKDALLQATAAELLREEAALFAAAAGQGGPPLQRVAEVATAVTAVFQEWGGDGRVLLQLWAADPDRLRVALEQIRTDLAHLIRQGQADGTIDRHVDPTLSAATIAGLIDGLLLQYFLDPEAFADLEDLGRHIRTTVTRMLAA